MQVRDRPGAPPGGRVHWFVLYARNWMRSDYTWESDYEHHAYRLVRKGAKDRQDDYTVIHKRGSRSWRLTYFDRPTKTMLHVRSDNLYGLLDRMDELREEKEAREDVHFESEEHECKTNRKRRLAEYQQRSRERKGR